MFKNMLDWTDKMINKYLLTQLVVFWGSLLMTHPNESLLPNIIVINRKMGGII